MFEAIGNEVVYLRRESIENLNMDGIKAGEFKEISKEEIYKKWLFSHFRQVSAVSFGIF